MTNLGAGWLGGIVAVALAAVTPAVAGDTLPPPQGDVILTITGAIDHPNSGDEVRLDRAALESLGMVAVTTTNLWSDGAITYEGPLVRDVLAAAGSGGSEVIATALNDYTATIPVADFLDYDVILALKADGAYLAIRDKGPIFIVYPFSTHAELDNEVYYARSVWQLARLAVK